MVKAIILEKQSCCGKKIQFQEKQDYSGKNYSFGINRIVVVKAIILGNRVVIVKVIVLENKIICSKSYS